MPSRSLLHPFARPSLATLGVFAALLAAAHAPAQNSGLDWLRFVGTAGDDDAGWPNGLHVAANGDVWVAGTDGVVAPSNATIVRLSSTGQTLSSWTLGGSNGTTRANAIATDPTGTLVYVAGRTTATTVLAVGNFVQGASAGGQDMFLAVLDAGSGTVIYWTYLGGSAFDVATDLDVDGQGRVWLYGATTSADFPVTANAYQATLGGAGDLAICCVDVQTPGPAGLVYSTFLGGAAADSPSDLQRHEDGTLSLAGLTAGSMPVTTATALQPNYGGGTFDAFYAHLDPAAAGAAQLLYCTYFGGSGQDNGNGLAVQGSVVTLGGWTQSTNLPTTVLPPAVQASKNLWNDAYMMQFDRAASGPSALRYCTYLGGSSEDGVNDLVVDAGGNVTIIGNGGSTNFQCTPGAFQTLSSGLLARTFVSKIDPRAGRLLYSTYLVDPSGPTNAFVARADGLGGIYQVGRTQAIALPVTTGPAHAGGWDLYVAHWNLLPDGAARWGLSTPSANGPSFAGVTEQPRTGAASFAITAGGVPTNCATTLGVLFASFGPPQATVPVPPFGTLYLAPPWITAAVVLPQGAPHASWPLSLAGVPIGTFAAFEFVWLDPCAAALSASNALEITVR